MRPLLFGGDEENQNSNAPLMQLNLKNTVARYANSQAN